MCRRLPKCIGTVELKEPVRDDRWNDEVPIRQDVLFNSKMQLSFNK